MRSSTPSVLAPVVAQKTHAALVYLSDDDQICSLWFVSYVPQSQ